jgi:hypothetical protein
MKDYDSSLARMAGNIASGLVSGTYERDRLLSRHSDALRGNIAEVSVDIAKRIIVLCKIEQNDKVNP